MLLQKPNQILSRNATVLGSRNSVSLEAARIEPLAHRTRCHFTDLCDLSRCEDLHHRLSNYSLVVFGQLICRGQTSCAPCLYARSTMIFFRLREPENTHKHLGQGLELASSCGGGSGPSDPCLTSIIGNFDSRRLLKIRKIEKLAKDFVFGFNDRAPTILSFGTRRGTFHKES